MISPFRLDDAPSLLVDRQDFAVPECFSQGKLGGAVFCAVDAMVQAVAGDLGWAVQVDELGVRQRRKQGFQVGKWHYLAAEQHFSNRGKRIACNCAKCVHHAQSRDRPNHHGHALLVQKLNQGFRLHEQAARHDDERRSHRQASENIFDGHVEVEWRLVCEPIAAVEFEFRNEFVDEADDGSMADNYAFGDAR